MTDVGNVHPVLSSTYEVAYATALDRIATTPGIQPRRLAPFWPKVGRLYDGDLLVIGRAVNGWVDLWDLDKPGDPAVMAATARTSAEDAVNGCPLGWVLDRWRRRDGGYDSSTSQFWETIRRVVVDGHPEWEADWVSHVAWTNLAKVAPWEGGNPGSRLLVLQRELGPALLAQEVKELAPRRVLALTGRGWFEPFATGLGLAVEWRDGYVEGLANDGERRWVVAVHPMTRSPRLVAEAIAAAFSSEVPLVPVAVRAVETHRAR